MHFARQTECRKTARFPHVPRPVDRSPPLSVSRGIDGRYPVPVRVLCGHSYRGLQAREPYGSRSKNPDSRTNPELPPHGVVCWVHTTSQDIMLVRHPPQP